MSWGRRKKEKPKFPNCVILPWEMVTHKAYLDLPPSACKELPFFLKKVKRRLYEPERYEEEFEFSYREANRYGFAIATHFRAISRLIEHGFIDPCAKGGMKSHGKGYNRFKLSLRWKNYGSADFVPVSWRNFQPKTEFKGKFENIN